jgi:hypothetical protein
LTAIVIVFSAPILTTNPDVSTKPHPEDVLVAEASETLELAEEQVCVYVFDFIDIFYFVVVGALLS